MTCIWVPCIKDALVAWNGVGSIDSGPEKSKVVLDVS
jgi:hypothetical protein